MEVVKKVDPQTARIVTFRIPSFMEPIDGTLPEETREMVIADGVGKFAGQTMVEVGYMSTLARAPIGFVYRQPQTYQGFRRGRDVFIDPENLKTANDRKGLWIKAEELGVITVENSRQK